MIIVALFFILIYIILLLFLIYWHNLNVFRTNLHIYAFHQENLALHQQLAMIKAEHQKQLASLTLENQCLNNTLAQKTAKKLYYTELEEANKLLEEKILSDIFNNPSTYYFCKKSCMSYDEASFLYYIREILSELIPENERSHYEVFPQYALHSIININSCIHEDSLEYEIARRNFTAKSIDFIICYHSTERNKAINYTYHLYTPILAIEIDGLSHYTNKAYGIKSKQRTKISDDIKNCIFSSTGIDIPLIRYTPIYVQERNSEIKQNPNIDTYKKIPARLNQRDREEFKKIFSQCLFQSTEHKVITL